MITASSLEGGRFRLRQTIDAPRLEKGYAGQVRLPRAPHVSDVAFKIADSANSEAGAPRCLRAE
jgi:hypothetical protein